MTVKGKTVSVLKKVLAYQLKATNKIGDFMKDSGKKGCIPLIIAGGMGISLTIMMEVLSFAEFGKF